MLLLVCFNFVVNFNFIILYWNILFLDYICFRFLWFFFFRFIAA